MGRWTKNEVRVLEETYPFIGTECTKYINRYSTEKRKRQSVAAKANREGIYMLHTIDVTRIEVYPCMLNDMHGVYIPSRVIFQSKSNQEEDHEVQKFLNNYEFLMFMSQQYKLFKVIGSYNEPFMSLQEDWTLKYTYNKSTIFNKINTKSVMGLFFTKDNFNILNIDDDTVRHYTDIYFKSFLNIESFETPEPNLEIIKDTAGVDLKYRGYGVSFLKATEPIPYLDYARNIPTIIDILENEYIISCLDEKY